ncbi:hypothetical protein OSH11_06785 [Kaistia dalseonensis]|nr:hypothetical protein [Kaistia dalseonensis]
MVPIRFVGRLVRNLNPDNLLAETEQVASLPTEAGEEGGPHEDLTAGFRARGLKPAGAKVRLRTESSAGHNMQARRFNLAGPSSRARRSMVRRVAPVRVGRRQDRAKPVSGRRYDGSMTTLVPTSVWL